MLLGENSQVIKSNKLRMDLINNKKKDKSINGIDFYIFLIVLFYLHSSFIQVIWLKSQNFLLLKSCQLFRKKPIIMRVNRS